MTIQYFMRAYKTTPTTGYVDWIVNDQPDSTGIYSGYDPSELTNITVNKTVQSKINNKLKPHNLIDGYFLLLNSYDWIHPPTEPFEPMEAPPQISGISIVRGSSDGIIPNDYASLFWDNSNNKWKFAFNTNGDGTTIGSSLEIETGPINIDGYLKLGTNPANSGIIRIPNSEIIKSRNSTNSTDVSLIQSNSSNQVEVGSLTNSVYIPSDLFVNTSISHAIADSSGQSQTGFIRTKNNDIILTVRNSTNTNDLNIIRSSTNSILIGDNSNTGINYNVGNSYVHKFLSNNLNILDLGSNYINFDIDVNSPSISQTTQTSGNGQTFTIKSQNTTGTTGGSLILNSGTGSVTDGYVQIKTGNNIQLQVNTNEVVSKAANYIFDINVTSPKINQQTQTSGDGKDLTICAQRANSGNGGDLLLSSGYGSLSSGLVKIESGETVISNFGSDLDGIYLDLGTNAAESGAIRLDNNRSLNARNNSDSGDLYIIGTNISDNVVIGNVSETVLIPGNLTVEGTTSIDYIISSIIDGYLSSFPMNIDGYISSGILLTSSNDGYFPAYVASCDGYIKNLILTCSEIPSAGQSVQVIIRKNLSDTLLSATLNDSTPLGSIGYKKTNLVNYVQVSEGDWITIRCLSSSSGSVDNLRILFNFETRL